MKMPFFWEPLSVRPMLPEILLEEPEEEDAADDVEALLLEVDEEDCTRFSATGVAATLAADVDVEANCCLA